MGDRIGFNFQPADREILFYLHYYVFFGEPLLGGMIVNYDYVNNFQVEQPPDVRGSASSGKLYCFVDCSEARRRSGQRNRRTVDGRGYWKCTRGQKAIYDENLRIAGYKMDFRFHQLAAETASTSWVMTEYTLEPNKSCNTKSVCVLRNTRGG